MTVKKQWTGYYSSLVKWCNERPVQFEMSRVSLCRVAPDIYIDINWAFEKKTSSDCSNPSLYNPHVFKYLSSIL